MTTIRILLVEDSADDAELILQALRRGGYDVTSERVQTREAMAEALDRRTWDAIISDYWMPEFDALGAFRALRDRGLDIPFIIVSGTVGEEVAVEAMKLGVHDYFLKGNLARLVPAIDRELRESATRKRHREAECALRQSEARFRRLADAGIIGIVISDMGGRILEANGAFLKMTGYAQEDVLDGRVDWAKMTPPEWKDINAAAVEQLKAHGAAGPWEKEYVRKDGTRVPVLIAVAALEGSQNLAIARDVSERKRLEEQFRRAQKMEAIGTLAGGVAHDFNNILSVILSYTDMILGDLPSSDPMHADLEEVRKAGARATDLTRQLLAFSRRQMLQPRVLDLNQIVTGMERMLRRLLGESIELSVRPARRVGKVHADPGQIEQVLMNLVVNARDAMPDGGTVTIETASAQLDADYAASHPGVTPGAYMTLAVADTGTGMDGATLARIFEPFFTTKDQGKGTGLGLATVYGIVRQHGGHVSVDSAVGTGTTFTVHLPRTDLRAEASSSLPPAPATLRGSETVLLVEDEEQVRAIMQAILRRLGYNVLEAQNGGEAFLICEKFEATIDLLLTDVVMPRMSGSELAERLALMRPQMKVLYVSGYTENLVIHQGVLDADVAYLQKPITPDALARRVREVLDAPPRVT